MRTRRRTAALLASAAAVALAVALSGTLLGLRGGTASSQSPAEAASHPPSSLGSLAPRPGPVGTAYASDGLAWQEVGIGTFDGVEDLALFPLDAGLLAVGTSRTAQTKLWLTADARAWLPLDGAAFQSNDPTKGRIVVTGVARGARGYVAVGALYDGTSTRVDAPPSTSPLAWRSPDARTWTRESPRGLPADALGFSSVVATTSGYAATTLTSTGMTSTIPGRLYTSPDGVAWTATSLAADRLVALEGHAIAFTSGGPAVYASDDAAGWIRAEGSAGVYDAVATQDGFVGVAYDSRASKTRILRSPDGRSWTAVGSTATEVIGSVTRAMSRWIQLGRPSAGWDTVTVQASDDLLTWRTSTIPYEVVGSAMLGELYPFGSGFLAVARHESPDAARLNEYGTLQAHLWWVRAANAGDRAGSTAPPTPAPATTPPAALTERRAIDIAKKRLPDWYETEPYGELITVGGVDAGQNLLPGDRWVWMVVVLVPRAVPCATPSSSCGLPYASKRVLVDALSGEIVDVLD